MGALSKLGSNQMFPWAEEGLGKPRIVLSDRVATSHVWIFKFKLK